MVYKKIIIIYDGECPFCLKYSNYLNLMKSFEKIEIKNARELTSIEFAELDQLGLDVNQGIIARVQMNELEVTTNYSGREAMNFLAKFDKNTKFVGKLHRLMRFKILSNILYPLLFWGRAVVLKLIGVNRIISTNNN